MPAFAIIPIAAAVSSKDNPAALASGATYFIASPVSETEEFVLFALAANTSATCPVCFASNPKPLTADAAISELFDKSSPDAAAKSNNPGIASKVSFTLNPAAARFSIPSAAWLAEKEVSAPN